MAASTIKRWLQIYRQNPDVTALIPRDGGPKLGQRRLSVPREQIATAAIDLWVQRMERLPVSWIVEAAIPNFFAARSWRSFIVPPSRSSSFKA